MKQQNKRSQNHSEFFVLLKKMAIGISAEDLKESLIHEFGRGKHKGLSDMPSIEYALMIGAMRAKIADHDNKQGDMWRKRVMSAIGGWLRIQSKEETANLIKGIACKAAGKDDKEQLFLFNKIPVTRLRAVYYEFIKAHKAIEASNEVTNRKRKK